MFLEVMAEIKYHLKYIRFQIQKIHMSIDKSIAKFRFTPLDDK
jgi:hypothetical protein